MRRHETKTYWMQIEERHTCKRNGWSLTWIIKMLFDWNCGYFLSFCIQINTHRNDFLLTSFQWCVRLRSSHPHSIHTHWVARSFFFILPFCYCCLLGAVAELKWKFSYRKDIISLSLFLFFLLVLVRTYFFLVLFLLKWQQTRYGEMEVDNNGSTTTFSNSAKSTLYSLLLIMYLFCIFMDFVLNFGSFFCCCWWVVSAIYFIFFFTALSIAGHCRNFSLCLAHTQYIHMHEHMNAKGYIIG